jgi:YD repeat-containing protein
VFAYDATGRLESIAQGARKAKWAYDAEGNVASMTDALGRVVGGLTRFTVSLR